MKEIIIEGWEYVFESNNMTALKIVEFAQEYILNWKGPNVEQKKVSIKIIVEDGPKAQK